MRLLPGFSFTFLLALLLSGTTPMGTGAGAHQFELVHPLFAHVHIVNGLVLTHDQLQQSAVVAWPATQRPTPGPTFGAGSGASQVAGLGISQILPTSAIGVVSDPIWHRLSTLLRPPAGRLRETPPDPPPTSIV